jgi:hypothetical protein
MAVPTLAFLTALVKTFKAKKRLVNKSNINSTRLNQPHFYSPANSPDQPHPFSFRRSIASNCYPARSMALSFIGELDNGTTFALI